MAEIAKAELTPAQKAAAVIVSLGAEKASLLYQFMEASDLEMLTLEVARLGLLDAAQTEAVLTEFYQACLTNKAVTEGGLEYARTVLEKAFGQQTALALLEKVTKSLKNREFAFLDKADVKSLYSALQNERPQTMALVLAYVDPDKAAGVIEQLPPDRQVKVVEAIATMESANPTAIKIIEADMERKFSNITTSSSVKVGGIDYVAGIMNNLDRSSEKSIFSASTTRSWPTRSASGCSFSRISSPWTTGPCSGCCGTAIPGIWCSPSRRPTPRWPTSSLATCPPVWRRPSGTTWKLQPMSA